MKSIIEKYDMILEALKNELKSFYGERLISAVVFGSVGRHAPNYNSDIDILIIAEKLPTGRIKRIKEFGLIEDKLESLIASLRNSGINTYISPVIKTPEEVAAGSPLFIDMTLDAQILIDKDGFFANELERLRKRLNVLGSKRIHRGNAFFWDLKPDYKPNEDIII
jgi:predicted nucleotidyltransferase